MDTSSLSVLLLCVQMVCCENIVSLLNPPEEAVPNHLLTVQYSCDRPSSVHLQSVVTFDTGTVSTFDLRAWSCDPGDPQTRSLTLALPDWLVYRPDGIVKLSQWVLSCLLKVSLRYGDGDSSVVVQQVVSLEPVSVLSRPFKQHQLCFSWSQQMSRAKQRFEQMTCPIEQETVVLLSSIFASTGEHYGITKTLQPFNNDLLEHLRLKAISFAWCTFSFWMLVTSPCRSSMCGVLHHIDREDNYASPAVFLTDSGQLHVQMSGEGEESSAFLCPFKVPLRQWCHIRVELHGRTVIVFMVCLDKGQRRIHSIQHISDHNLVLDDTEGYFVIGGGKYVRSVEGYFGPVMFYRNRIPSLSQSYMEVPDVIRMVNLTGWMQTCGQFQLQINRIITGYTLREKQRESCTDVYHQYMDIHSRHTEPQSEDWEEVSPNRKYAAKVVKWLVQKRAGGMVNLWSVGRSLYLSSLHKLRQSQSLSSVQRVLRLLLQAGCLQDPHALHMSAVIYSSGLGVPQRYDKSWLLSLRSAQKDHRLSLLHLGFIHLHGLYGLQADPDLAYAYYSNIAQQTVEDRYQHSTQQTFVESVYLNDEEVLNQQTSEDHHIFQWLKLQARRGEAQAERTIGQLLYWGQQGISPDLQKAVRHYQRGALHQDPVSMYDYGIVLLTGKGGEQDIPKGVSLLKRAMEKGSVPAMNALAWYYEQFEQDYVEAVRLWERADLQDSPDAAMNLGVMYLQGLYPGRQTDQYLAYEYFLKSARRGHLRAALQVAEIWITGITGQVDRRPLDAVRWLKWAAEHNGHLGLILRKGLEHYFKNDMLNSLLYFLMAAESGFAAAQFNVAYLCEQNTGNFLDSAFVASCMWNYYNLTIQSGNPNTYALIKMGDLFNEGHGGEHRDVLSAALMYTEAAHRHQPQGLYNLGLLVEEGHTLPLSVLSQLGLSQLYLADKIVLLKALYQKCRDSEDSDSFLPCSLALFSVHLKELKKDYSAAIMYSSALVAAVAPTLFVLLSRLHHRTRPGLTPELTNNDV